MSSEDKSKQDENSGKGPTNPPGQDKHFSIIVNGRKKQVKESSLSYGDVIKLAFPNDKTGTGYTVTYSMQ